MLKSALSPPSIVDPDDEELLELDSSPLSVCIVLGFSLWPAGSAPGIQVRRTYCLTANLFWRSQVKARLLYLAPQDG